MVSHASVQTQEPGRFRCSFFPSKIEELQPAAAQPCLCPPCASLRRVASLCWRAGSPSASTASQGGDPWPSALGLSGYKYLAVARGGRAKA